MQEATEEEVRERVDVEEGADEEVEELLVGNSEDRPVPNLDDDGILEGERLADAKDHDVPRKLVLNLSIAVFFTFSTETEKRRKTTKKAQEAVAWGIWNFYQSPEVKKRKMTIAAAFGLFLLGFVFVLIGRFCNLFELFEFLKQFCRSVRIGTK